ncbi:Transposable element Tc3 transposase [Araneus ventricosus]|uniref:Transposable element Tc3 transposase n=1 Tax=Araneus ventricosus TaxID=182803 RepID=A0A4Y2EN38_ARAVE|nr:Transposable element Tc3 transposase [Araneus ventricosus]
MVKGKKLTDHERGQTEAFYSTGMSSRTIAIKIGRSKTVVNNFLKLKDNYGKKNTGERLKALSSRDERRVCRLASTGKYSTRKLIQTTGLNVCQITMYNTIRRSGSYIYTAKLAKPRLLQRHKVERLNFSQQVMTWDNQWIQTIFSDEKKWNSDGPDRWKYYWLKRQIGGGSVITSGCFAYNGVGSIAFVSDKMNSQTYQIALASHLLPNAEFLAGENWKYQQDNAPFHSSNNTKNWFQVNNAETLK